MKLPISYKNGNYFVEIQEDGTKIRTSVDSCFIPRYPESIDLKITNWCDMNCPMCHEESDKYGTHADLKEIASLIKNLPEGVEFAIGGGDPLSHPNIIELICFLDSRGIIPNITINSGHLLRHKYVIDNLVKHDWIKGIGISYDSTIPLETFWSANTYRNVVIHLILGIHTIKDLGIIFSNVSNAKVLLLGYKKIGRGKEFYTLETVKNILEWYHKIHEFFGFKIIAFDNLSIEQLNVKRFFDEENWSRFYQGNDGQFTFYVDLVRKEYAISSTSEVRYPIRENDTFESMFQDIRGKV